MDIRPHSDFDARRGTGPRPTVTNWEARFPTALSDSLSGRARVLAHVSSVLNQDLRDFSDFLRHFYKL